MKTLQKLGQKFRRLSKLVLTAGSKRLHLLTLTDADLVVARWLTVALTVRCLSVLLATAYNASTRVLSARNLKQLTPGAPAWRSLLVVKTAKSVDTLTLLDTTIALTVIVNAGTKTVRSSSKLVNTTSFAVSASMIRIDKQSVKRVIR